MRKYFIMSMLFLSIVSICGCDDSKGNFTPSLKYILSSTNINEFNQVGESIDLARACLLNAEIHGDGTAEVKYGATNNVYGNYERLVLKPADGYRFAFLLFEGELVYFNQRQSVFEYEFYIMHEMNFEVFFIKEDEHFQIYIDNYGRFVTHEIFKGTPSASTSFSEHFLYDGYTLEKIKYNDNDYVTTQLMKQKETKFNVSVNDGVNNLQVKAYYGEKINVAPGDTDRNFVSGWSLNNGYGVMKKEGSLYAFGDVEMNIHYEQNVLASRPVVGANHYAENYAKNEYNIFIFTNYKDVDKFGSHSQAQYIVEAGIIYGENKTELSYYSSSRKAISRTALADYNVLALETAKTTYYRPYCLFRHIKTGQTGIATVEILLFYGDIYVIY